MHQVIIRESIYSVPRAAAAAPPLPPAAAAAAAGGPTEILKTEGLPLQVWKRCHITLSEVRSTAASAAWQRILLSGVLQADMAGA